jgi:hypothetical protein
MYLIMPPRKAISVPDLKEVKKSAFEEVRVNLGSTLIILPPRFMASVTHLKEMGWFSAALEPMIRIQSLFRMSIQWLVIAPRPNDSARAATVALCQIRA